MKTKSIFGLLVLTLLFISCGKSVDESYQESLWRSPSGLVMTETEMLNWEEVEQEFKETIADNNLKIKPQYYKSQDCSTPQIPCGLKCIETSNKDDADCQKAYPCLPCMNCCIGLGF